MDLYSEEEWNALYGHWLITPDEARNYRESVTARGLSPWTIRISEALIYGYGQVRDDDVFSWNAFGKFLELFPQATKSAIDECWQQGWIQRLSRDFLLSQQAEIEEGGYEIVNNLLGADLIGSEQHGLDGMVGLIDVTAKGVSFFFSGEDEHPDHWVIRVIDGESGEVFGTSEEACRCPLDMSWNFESESPIKIVTSEKIGRWCDRWWRRFETGHLIRFRVHDPEIAASLLGTPS